MSDEEFDEQEIEREAEMWRPSEAMSPERFAYLWSVAERITQSSVVPESLRTEGSGSNKTGLPYETIVANVFLVADQADAWNLRLNAVLPCASIVRGRMCFEGKLISAVLRSRFGIDLKYAWSGEGDGMRIVVSGTKPGSDEVLTVEGSVGEWKTTGTGSPWMPKNFKKMLAYRGAREWARLHQPSAIVGVLGDDEIEFEHRALMAREVPELGSALGGDKGADGFHPDNMRAIADQQQEPMQVGAGPEREAVPVNAQEAAESGSSLPESKSRGEPEKSAKDPNPKEQSSKAEKPNRAGPDDKPNPACSLETMREYSSALMRALQPKTLPGIKKEFWDKRPRTFDDDSNKRLSAIYTVHVRRCAKEIDIAECDRQVKAIIEEPQ